jgi:hypothetical protein
MTYVRPASELAADIYVLKIAASTEYGSPHH